MKMTKDEILKAQKLRIANLKQQSDILNERLKNQNQIIKNLEDTIERLNIIIDMQELAIKRLKGE